MFGQRREGKAYSHHERRGEDEIVGEEIAEGEQLGEARGATASQANRYQAEEERHSRAGKPGRGESSSDDSESDDTEDHRESDVQDNASERDGGDKTEGVGSPGADDVRRDDVERSRRSACPSPDGDERAGTSRRGKETSRRASPQFMAIHAARKRYSASNSRDRD